MDDGWVAADSAEVFTKGGNEVRRKRLRDL